MNKHAVLIKKIKQLVKDRLKNESTGHDYWHAYRVAQNALHIAKKENANIRIVEISAWLHDIAAGHDKDHEIRGAKFAKKLLNQTYLSKNEISQVCKCIKNHRFSKGVRPETVEEKIIQDADKLDALGAVGIARLFILSGFYHQILHDPNIKPDFNYYLKHSRSNTTINHFYDKLFKLKKLLHTKTAKQIASKREKFMKLYITRFYSEWEG